MPCQSPSNHDVSYLASLLISIIKYSNQHHIIQLHSFLPPSHFTLSICTKSLLFRTNSAPFSAVHFILSKSPPTYSTFQLFVSSSSIKSAYIMPQTYEDRPDLTQEALATFQPIRECVYARKELGALGQHEIMTCDCHEAWNGQNNEACGDDTGCINRATSVECVGNGTCGSECQNRRFQKHQYAPVAVIDAGKKGYGVRAEEQLVEGQFICEYVGEVIDESMFRDRMVQYDEQGFRHFYFMMLKKDSFIDATMKGAIARFCNHLCSPNAYVDKWVVGLKLRMGIFAKRAVAIGEEITFDYNVDRYGAQLQPCYCGEPNCIGFMGGKTQTDSALLLPDGVADALGVTPTQERAWLRENKHLRSKQQDDEAAVNEAFIKLIVTSKIDLADVLKVMSALMKPQDKLVVRKILERIGATTDAAVNSLVIRVHGYKTMSQLLREYGDDESMVREILEILLQWPRITKNKILLLQIEDVVEDIEALSKDLAIKELLQSLLNEWGALKMAYRIPKNELPMTKHSRLRSPERGSGREPLQELDSDATGGTEGVVGVLDGSYGVDGVNGSSNGSNDSGSLLSRLPEGWEMAVDEASQLVYYFHRELGVLKWERPTDSDNNGAAPGVLEAPPVKEKPKKKYHKDWDGHNGGKNGGRMYAREEERLKAERQSKALEVQEKDRLLQEVILRLQKEAEEKRLALEKERIEAQEAKEQERKRRRMEKKVKTKPSSEKKTSRLKEAQWVHLLARTVPNLIKEHEKEIGHDNLKGCSRDIVRILAQKEVKKNADAEVPEALDSHKRTKVRQFCADYMKRVLEKKKSKREQREEK